MPVTFGPNVNGGMTNVEFVQIGGTTATGAFVATNTVPHGNYGQSEITSSNNIAFNAHKSNAIYTDNGKVYPASIALNYIIKA